MIMKERISDKELVATVDSLQDRLKELYAEQKEVQVQLILLVDIMMKRGLKKAISIV